MGCYGGVWKGGRDIIEIWTAIERDLVRNEHFGGQEDGGRLCLMVVTDLRSNGSPPGMRKLLSNLAHTSALIIKHNELYSSRNKTVVHKGYGIRLYGDRDKAM